METPQKQISITDLLSTPNIDVAAKGQENFSKVQAKQIRLTDKLTPKKLYEIRNLLLEGNDPFLLAMYYRVTFPTVARLANAILRERAPAGTEPVLIPELVEHYISLAIQLYNANEMLRAEGAKAANESLGDAKIELPAPAAANP